ncbi:MarR family EPS-associated transcriptional regulator [Herbaspirillum sp. meg3]|uniref:MarR family EPS-associated transcriptional regulator n=1 Tax=Herbaspirillum sp. meg3 TaxID=2025949 RepID=UPI000B999D3A|nr:MarR family EPS-associated transcriptional regulator [Herbaspirillum sp. meg3]ASU40585.1 MarR family EPS-associated transcriptional regulator [Herbaspirillum sp. meg3]
MLDEKNRYKILKSLESRPEISQRELAKELGISLGKVNFCINALVAKGLVKVNNFQSNPNKRGYIYLLTPRGIEAKANLTMEFLKIKMQEYEALSHEIESLQYEVAQLQEVKS